MTPTSTIPAVQPATTECVICGRDDIPTEGKFIHYCIIRQGRKVIGREYCGWYDGRPINYGDRYEAVLTELDDYASDLARQTAIETADLEALAHLPNQADPPERPDDPGTPPPWEDHRPDIFDMYRAAYGLACVTLEAITGVGRAA